MAQHAILILISNFTLALGTFYPINMYLSIWKNSKRTVLIQHQYIPANIGILEIRTPNG